MSTKWWDIAQEKRQAVNSLLPEKWKTTKPIPPVAELPDVTDYAASFPSETEREITAQYTASELVGKLARREYTAVQVIEAFCHRATIAHELVPIPVR
jgi:amidase